MNAYTALIPAYNAADFIGEAIASIRAQSVPPTQIIVVDDGSNDGTGDVVRSNGDDIIVIRQENRGVGSATTAGFAAATAPLVATLDADDIWLPHKMETQLARLAGEPALAGVFGNILAFHRTRQETTGSPVEGWLRSTMAIRRAVFEQAGPIIDPPGGCGDMVDWLARVREGGHRLAMLDETLALRRIRPGSLSNSGAAKRDGGYLFAARQAILRRRARED